jgi:hypothetical protein
VEVFGGAGLPSTRSVVGTNKLPLGVVATEVEAIVEFRDQVGA